MPDCVGIGVVTPLPERVVVVVEGAMVEREVVVGPRVIVEVLVLFDLEVEVPEDWVVEVIGGSSVTEPTKQYD